MSQPIIRKALPQDSKAIFEARSNSIRDLCGAEYSEEQLKAWAFGDYKEDDIDRFVRNSTTWVVVLNEKVEGVAQIMNDGEIRLLYLTKLVAGQKLGKRLMGMMELRAKELGIKELRLRSSKTAHAFYQSCGFFDCSEEKLANSRGASAVH